MPRQRSLSITPTYSTDRAVLLETKPNAIALSVDEAKSALSTLDIYKDATFKRRVKLDSIEEWTDFLQSCTDSNNSINLEVALKKCYSNAYSMPPSPMAHSRTNPRDTPEPLTV